MLCTRLVMIFAENITSEALAGMTLKLFGGNICLFVLVFYTT